MFWLLPLGFAKLQRQWIYCCRKLLEQHLFDWCQLWAVLRNRLLQLKRLFECGVGRGHCRGSSDEFHAFDWDIWSERRSKLVCNPRTCGTGVNKLHFAGWVVVSCCQKGSALCLGRLRCQRDSFDGMLERFDGFSSRCFSECDN